ncbi:hypothetical protein M2350_002437 [Candidatus Fervidibacter sacchari]|uniref:Uncharacterized protein n=1 Tax=Candidatus Fervidibacter sacchari TaxID=1448929 RepID=A0ABT2ESZ5_9BACT|nr:hypothetical protein [Candidatus Fervidibacter sacchari]
MKANWWTIIFAVFFHTQFTVHGGVILRDGQAVSLVA